MYLLKLFLVPYLLTIIVELLFAIIWGCRSFKEFLAVFCINTITNPAVTFIRLMSTRNIPSEGTRTLILIAAEIAVLISEWLLFKKFIRRIKHPFFMSLTLNAASFGAGLLLPYIFFLVR